MRENKQFPDSFPHHFLRFLLYQAIQPYFAKRFCNSFHEAKHVIITWRNVKQVILKINVNRRTSSIVASKGIFATNFQLNLTVGCVRVLWDGLHWVQYPSAFIVVKNAFSQKSVSLKTYLS